MRIHAVGANHRSAPVELRGRLAYPSSFLAGALARSRNGGPEEGWPFAELVILSTCNRLEVYSAADDDLLEPVAAYDALARFVAETHGIDQASFRPYLYCRSDESAVAHLCRVAAGLDSMIIGESEILGQVTRAHDTSLRHAAAGPVLSAAFQAAIRAGRRARSETEIGHNAASVSSVAVELAAEQVHDLAGRSVLLVGTGKMGARVADTIRARGATQLAVASRALQRARALADRCGAQAFGYDELRAALGQADVIITATDAPHHVIDAAMVRDAIRSTGPRERLFIDIAVPRDVEPAVRQCEGVRVFDLDDLQARLRDNVSEREKEVPQVEAIIAEELAVFHRWLRAREVAPILQSLHQKVEAIRRREVDRALRRLGTVGDREREQIERLSVSLVKKLLHEPTVQLRAEATNGRAAELAEVTRKLFALETPVSPGPETRS